jgi:apolipoprotein N-acyltransferase
VSLLCVLVSALLVEALGSRPRTRALAPVGVALIILLAWWAYGQARLSAHDSAPVQKRWTAALVQPNPSLAEKRSLKPKPRLPMYRRAERLTRGLDLTRVDVLVWPEGSLPFFYVPLPEDPEAGGMSAKAMRAPRILQQITRKVRKLGAELNKPFVFGALRRTDPLWKKRARNAAVILKPGQAPRFYDKQLLVPFGEFMPGRDWIPALAEAIPGISDMDPGSGDAIFELGGARVALTICYEALFPQHVWQAASDADVLLNLTDDVWFGPTNAPELHLMVQVARAVELRRPLVRATATGISALVDAAGRIKMRTGVWTEDARIVTAEVRDLDSPFRLWGMWPMWLLVAGVVLWLAWRFWSLRAGQPQTKGH